MAESENGKLDVANARNRLDEDAKERMQGAIAALADVEKRFGVRFIPHAVLSPDGRITAMIHTVPEQ